MPDLGPLWNISTNLLFGVVLWTLALSFIFSGNFNNRLTLGIYIAGLTFIFITALIALLITAKSLGL